MLEHVSDIVAFILPIVILSVFAYFYFGGKKKGKVEHGKIALLQEQCGGCFDGFNLTIPFVRHAIYDNFVVISYGSKEHVLRFQEIQNVTIKRHILSKGITYRHSQKELPGSIIIWTISFNKVLKIFEQKGVKILK